MHNFADLMLVSIIAVAVVLLLLILISFILNARRINHLEHELSRLETELQAQKTGNTELSNNLQTIIRRSASNDKTIRMLSQTSDDLVDKCANLEGSLQKLSVKQELDKKIIEQNIPEQQSTYDATRLLKQGLSVEEVVSRTNIPRNEVEMMCAVQGIKSEEETKHLESPAISPMSDMAKAHVASSRARSAYGIGASLKKR